jgi:hypothetical protein
MWTDERALVTGFATLLTLMLVAGSSSARPRHPPKKNPRQLVVKAFGAPTPQGRSQPQPPRVQSKLAGSGTVAVISGGFEMRGVVPVFR